MDPDPRLESLLRAMASRSRPVRIVAKRGLWHQTLADTLLRWLTLGRQTRYLSAYVTTLGHTVYVPDTWDRTPPLQRYCTLRHELVHVAQFERYGWVGMALLYGLLPLPMGLAYGRATLEREAYIETLRAVAETQGLSAARDPALHQWIIQRFTGPDYAWMWPFAKSVHRWLDAAVRDLETPRGA